MRIAIVSDGLWANGGAERVLECILSMYPDADLYTLVDFLPDHGRGWLNGRRVNTSFLQRIPGVRLYFRKLLSLWPLAVEQFDLSDYDLVISTQHAVAHGVITKPYQTHITYTYSPMRYVWDLQTQYLREADLHRGLKTFVARPILHHLRMWDAAAAARVDAFAADSAFVAERIRKYYRRDSAVIYPPVLLERFNFRERKDDYYFCLGRLVAHKRLDLIIDAFAAMPDRKLVIAGDGPMLKAWRARATPNVHVMGAVDAACADKLMGGARAYIHAAIEDFGIAPVEAQAAGTPVIGLGVGGLLETVRDLADSRPTGLFFAEQTTQAVCDAIETFERLRGQISPLDCRANAARFAPQNFRDAFRGFVIRALREFGSSSPGIRPNNPAAAE